MILTKVDLEKTDIISDRELDALINYLKTEERDGTEPYVVKQLFNSEVDLTIRCIATIAKLREEIDRLEAMYEDVCYELSED